MSRSPLPFLLWLTLLELLALPFHLAAFLARRDRIRREVLQTLRRGPQDRTTP